MKKKTVELIIKIGEIAMEVLIFLKDKMNGRKGNDDDKGDAKKK